MLALPICILLDIYSVYQSDRIESLLQEAENYLQMSENCENQKDYVSALRYCTDAASECFLPSIFLTSDVLFLSLKNTVLSSLPDRARLRTPSASSRVEGNMGV